MENVLISVKNIRKVYSNGKNNVNVLKKVNFDIKEGEFTSIMGPSGCGKSTLLYIVGGLEKPTSGKIIIDNKDICTLKDKEQSKLRCKDIGFVFQFYNLVQNLTVEENIMLPVVMAGEKTSAYKAELSRLLSILDIKDKRKALPSSLSGGQCQRVAIARAVIMKPKIILADEPTGNLDSESGKQVMNLFKKIHKENGISILMVTHSEEIAKQGERILKMSDGKIIDDISLL